jgi:peptide/nickel transport system permease protein
MAGISPSPSSSPGVPLAPASAAPRLVWLRLRRNWLSAAALALIVLMILAAVLAGWVAPYEPDATDADAALQAPSLHHWLGTDIYGRDLLSRIIYAARVDLAVAFGATALALAIGSSIGVAAGLYRGIVDLLIMRCVDSIMAFPAFILAMAITAALGNSVGNVLIAIALTPMPRASSATRPGGSCSSTCCPTRCPRSSCRPRWRWATLSSPWRRFPSSASAFSRRRASGAR